MPEFMPRGLMATLAAPAFFSAYFTVPRPVIETYDLESDPGELNNLAGRPESAGMQRQLTVALQESMMVDFDFLPPPTAN